jgi:ketol-acid reductoisomerase
MFAKFNSIRIITVKFSTIYNIGKMETTSTQEPRRGYNKSIWVDAVKEKTTYPKLEGSKIVEVAIIGGGITGLTTAMKLKEMGKQVAVIEASTIGSGVTGYSTAKLSSLHRLVFDSLLNEHGVSGAKQYAEMNEQGINLIEEYVKKYGIDCDFVRLPNYTYTSDSQMVSKIRKEVEAASRAGLQATFTTETGSLLIFLCMSFDFFFAFIRSSI